MSSPNFKETKQIVPLLDATVRYEQEVAYQNVAGSLFTLEEKLELLADVRKNAIKFYAPVVDLSGFPEMYPMAGITEGLNNFALDIARRGKGVFIAPGDYEWIKQYFGEVAHDRTIRYVSNPSARDGNYLTPAEWDEALTSSVVALDCAYVGASPIQNIPLTDKVTNVFVGASKTFGLPDLRVGLQFRKNQYWGFKVLTEHGYFNPYNLYVYNHLLKTFTVEYLWEQHHERQVDLCAEHGLTPSDVVFLATSHDPQYSFFDRAGINRLCLTDLW